MTHTISSNISSTMKQIYELHWETANEVASKSGRAIAMAQRNELLANKTYYDIEYVDGKRRIIKTDTSRPVGKITNKQGIILSTRLENFIQWRTYSTTGTTVVGGMFKSGWTELREGGKVIGRTKTDSVGQGSINILQKLNYGLNSESNKINTVNNAYNWGGKKSLDNFKGTHTRGYGFAEKGRRNAMSEVNTLMKDGFKDALARREKYVDKKMTKVS